MKRVLSLFVVLTMLLSLVAVAIPASSAATLDENNVGIVIPYYSGSAYFRQIGGSFPKQSYNNDEDEYEIHDMIDADPKPGDHVIILDGAINSKYKTNGIRIDQYDEWGEPLFTIKSTYAAQMKTKVPSAENTYYWNDGTLSDLAKAQGLEANIWLAWDEDYLYVAAQVFDPDQHLLKSIGEDIWNGDAIQLRVDPDGPNSIVDGSGYDASVNEYPWKTTVRNGGGETYGGNVMNMGVGISGAGKMDIYDMAPRYTPAMEEVTDPDTAEKVQGLVWHKNGAYGFADKWPANPFGDAFGAVGMFNERPTVNGTTNNNAYTRDYEVAIPWAYMNGSYIEWDEETETSTLHLVDDVPAAGDEFGIAIAILNAARGGEGYNSWLTWGSGICGGQMSEGDYMTAGGSNSMVLSSEELGTIKSNGSAMHEHNFSDPTCDAPYVCQTCGYEKGLAVGHKYTHEVISVPTSNSNGLIKSTCTFCNGVVETVVPKGASTVWHDFSKELKSFTTSGINETEWGGGESNGWAYLYVDDDGYPIFRQDGDRVGQQKNLLETYEGRTVIDISTSDPGTYFATQSKYTNFAYSYDIRLTGNRLEEDGNKNYLDGIYHQFGGVYPTVSGNLHGMRYSAGFFLSEGSTTKGTFRIYDAPGCVTFEGIEKGTNILLAESAEIDLGTDWHNFTLAFDPESNTAIFYLDGEAVVGVWDPGLTITNDGQYLMIRRFDFACMIADMKLGTPTAFNAPSGDPTPTGYTVTCDGNVVGTYEEGETVTLPVPAVVPSGANTVSRFYTWNVVSGDAEVLRSKYSADNDTANSRTYTLVMPAENVELKAEYVVIGDVDGNGSTNANDYRALKLSISVGNDDAKSLEACDVDGDGLLTTRDSLRCRQLVDGGYVPAK